MSLVQPRQGECQRMENHGSVTQLTFYIPARGLIGLRTRLLNATQGTAIVHHNFLEYRPLKGTLPGRATGVYLSKNTAKVTAYSAEGLAGNLFVSPQQEVYEGQIVGEHGRDKDMVVNVTDPKPLTNMRASGSDKAAVLKPAMQFSLEMALEYIEDDELVEITPKSVRMRKIYLKEADRKKAERQKV
jgi:GTP-binding protein